jgi:hypothetical protein
MQTFYLPCEPSQIVSSQLLAPWRSLGWEVIFDSGVLATVLKAHCSSRLGSFALLRALYFRYSSLAMFWLVYKSVLVVVQYADHPGWLRLVCELSAAFARGDYSSISLLVDSRGIAREFVLHPAKAQLRLWSEGWDERWEGLLLYCKIYILNYLLSCNVVMLFMIIGKLIIIQITY